MQSQPRLQWLRAAQGAVLAVGAPFGWLLLRLFDGASLADEVRGQRALYWYLWIGTSIAFAIFGAVIGRHEDWIETDRQRRLDALRAELDRIRRESDATAARARAEFDAMRVRAEAIAARYVELPSDIVDYADRLNQYRDQLEATQRALLDRQAQVNEAEVQLALERADLSRARADVEHVHEQFEGEHARLERDDARGESVRRLAHELRQRVKGPIQGVMSAVRVSNVQGLSAPEELAASTMRCYAGGRSSEPWNHHAVAVEGNLWPGQAGRRSGVERRLGRGACRAHRPAPEPFAGQGPL